MQRNDAGDYYILPTDPEHNVYLIRATDGFTFLHNGDNRWGQDSQPRRSFDMRSRRLFEQLDLVELKALKNLAAVTAKAQ